MPMHIGGLYIVAPVEKGRPFNFNEFRTFFEERLHLTPVFRRRLVEVPMNLGRPFWVNDPDFNLDAHLVHVALPSPATKRSLAKLAAQLYSPPLDRSRPLWKFTFITGIEDIEDFPDNAFAMLVQVHHANIDGVSGAELMAALFDMFPKPRKIAPPDSPWQPEPLPSYRELIARSYTGASETPSKVFHFIKDAASSVADVAKAAAANLAPPPPLVMEAPSTILNKPVTPTKTFSGIDIPLDRIKKIKSVAGVKVNDVVLALCSAALRKYLLEKDALPKSPMIAMVPISVRTEEENGTAGNRISFMLADLATNEERPPDRLAKIHLSTLGSKIYSKATPVDQIVELIPSEVGALASRFYTQMGLSKLHRPFFNVIITNVPGPPIPLYMNGYQLHHHYGLGVTFEGIGLMIVVFSYAGNVSICATSCESIMPDVARFTSFIHEGLDDLEETLIEKKREEEFFERLKKKHGA